DAKPASSRCTPTPRESMLRTRDASGVSGRLVSGGRLRRPAEATAPETLSAAQLAQTAASISELIASRLAPGKPLPPASPQAQRAGTEPRRAASTATPPIW